MDGHQADVREAELWITLEEAAALTGRSRSAMWRRHNTGRLPSRVAEDGRILVRRDALRSSRDARDAQDRDERAVHDATPASRSWAPSDPEPNEPRRDATERDATHAQDAMSRDAVPVAVHLAVFQRLNQAEVELRRQERMNEALLGELRLHRLALEDHARSIVEREARAREAEAKLGEAAAAAETDSQVKHEALRSELDEARAGVLAEARRRRQLEEELAATRDRLVEERSRRDQVARAQMPWWKRILGGGPARA